jgi:hypothetical protein
MTPFEIGSLVLGAGGLANSIFSKPQQQKVDTSADLYAQMIGPILGGANQQLSFAARQAEIAAGEKAGLQAMYGGGEQSSQLGIVGEAIDKERTASNLQAGIAGQSAGAVLGLEESAGKGKLATELQPVQTAGELAKSYADAAGKISMQGTQNLGEIAKSAILGTAQLGDTGIKAQQGIAEKTIGAASEQGVAAQQGTSLLANTLQQGTTELGKTTLAGETELLKATSSAVPAAGLAALAGENALAQDIAKTNLRIKENQESIRGQMALLRAKNEGEQATRRQGALFAMQGHSMFRG